MSLYVWITILLNMILYSKYSDPHLLIYRIFSYLTASSGENQLINLERPKGCFVWQLKKYVWNQGGGIYFSDVFLKWTQLQFKNYASLHVERFENVRRNGGIREIFKTIHSHRLKLFYILFNNKKILSKNRGITLDELVW